MQLIALGDSFTFIKDVFLCFIIKISFKFRKIMFEMSTFMFRKYALELNLYTVMAY